MHTEDMEEENHGGWVYALSRGWWRFHSGKKCGMRSMDIVGGWYEWRGFWRVVSDIRGDCCYLSYAVHSSGRSVCHFGRDDTRKVQT